MSHLLERRVNKGRNNEGLYRLGYTQILIRYIIKIFSKRKRKNRKRKTKEKG